MRTPDDHDLPMNEEDAIFPDEVKEVLQPGEMSKLDRSIQVGDLDKLAALDTKVDELQNEAAIKDDHAAVDEEELVLPQKKHLFTDLGSTTLQLIAVDLYSGDFTPTLYCAAVSARFKEARNMRYSPKDEYWQHWSLALNKVWIVKCHKCMKSLQLKAAMVYWWNRNECLKLWAEKPLYKQTRKRKLNKDAKVIRAIADGRRILHPEQKGYQKVVMDFNTIYEHYKSYFAREARKEAVDDAPQDRAKQADVPGADKPV